MADQKTPAAFVEGEAVEVCFDERPDGWERWETATVGDRFGLEDSEVRIAQPSGYVGVFDARDVRRPR